MYDDELLVQETLREINNISLEDMLSDLELIAYEVGEDWYNN